MTELPSEQGFNGKRLGDFAYKHPKDVGTVASNTQPTYASLGLSFLSI